MVSPRAPCQDCLLGQSRVARVAPEADHEAPMPGHLTRGGGTRQGSQEGRPRSGHPPYTLPRRHQPGMHRWRQEDRDRRLTRMECAVDLLRGVIQTT